MAKKKTTKRKSSAGMKKGQSAIMWISKRAGEMRKANSSLTQPMAIKKASAEYRANKK